MEGILRRMVAVMVAVGLLLSAGLAAVPSAAMAAVVESGGGEEAVLADAGNAQELGEMRAGDLHEAMDNWLMLGVLVGVLVVVYLGAEAMATSTY